MPAEKERAFLKECDDQLSKVDGKKLSAELKSIATKYGLGETIARTILTFGMYEMEEAAEQIVDMAISQKTWNVSVTYDQIGDKSGFLQLLYGQFLQPYLLSKRVFRVTNEFVERVAPKYGNLVSDLAPVLSVAELYGLEMNRFGKLNS